MDGGMQIDGAAQRSYATLATEVVHHYIADSELDGLSDMPSEPAKEICLVALGAALSTVLPAWQAMGSFQARRPLSGSEMLALMLMAISAALALCCGHFWRRRLREVPRLREQIRARPRVMVEFNRAAATVLLTYPDPGDPAA